MRGGLRSPTTCFPLEVGQAVFQGCELTLVVDWSSTSGWMVVSLRRLSFSLLLAATARFSLAGLDGFADGLEFIVPGRRRKTGTFPRHYADGHVCPGREGIDVFHGIRVIEAHRMAVARQFDDFLVFPPLGVAVDEFRHAGIFAALGIEIQVDIPVSVVRRRTWCNRRRSCHCLPRPGCPLRRAPGINGQTPSARRDIADAPAPSSTDERSDRPALAVEYVYELSRWPRAPCLRMKATGSSCAGYVWMRPAPIRFRRLTLTMPEKSWPLLRRWPTTTEL